MSGEAVSGTRYEVRCAQCPSRTALARVGERVDAVASFHGRPMPANSGSGVVDLVEATGTWLWTGDSEPLPGIRYRVRRDDGSTFWTVAFADDPDEEKSTL